MGELFPSPFIGCWMQPASNDSKLQTLGCNVKIGFDLQGPDNETARANFRGSAVQHGMGYLIPASKDPRADLYKYGFLGWLHGDEPDQDNAKRVPGPELAKATKSLKAIDPTRLVMANFDGSQVVGKVLGWNSYDYPAAIAGLDVVGFDEHPCNWGQDGTKYVDDPQKIVSYLRSIMSPQQKLVACVEASWENLGAPGTWASTNSKDVAKFHRPSPAELAFQVNNYYRLGVDGVYFFFHRIGANFETAYDVSVEDENVIKQLSMQKLIGSVAPDLAALSTKLSAISNIKL